MHSRALTGYRRTMLFTRHKTELPTPDTALPGREQSMEGLESHRVLGTPIVPPFPDGFGTIVVGMGCFWGAEKLYWQSPGIHTTAVGYAGGFTRNPTYEEVCSGRTGHAEVVLAVYDPSKTSYEQMLRIFWEGHDPTEGMRQGNDAGTQYRSAIYWQSEAERDAALASRDRFQQELSRAGYGEITTEITKSGPFYYAEPYHQQYLAWNPRGYCPDHSTGLSCPVDLGVDATVS
jgi:peptide-methionine (S)-S-oxide reductase